MQKNNRKNPLSPISVIWICNLMLFVTYFMGSSSLSFLKSSVLEYKNITSDPFDGTISPIAYVPDWSKSDNMDKSRTFESFTIADFIEIPEYDTELLADTLQKTKSASVLRYAYPVVYMGSYRGNYTEYDGSHAAVDIRAPIGTPVVSIANGVVVKVKNLETGDGKYVIIRHDNVEINGAKETLYSGYEHLSKIIAIEGNKIKRGEVLGKVGMTGITTTPHLHFQIDRESSPFHMYWPYTFKEAADLGLDFFGAINVGLGKENAIRYTIHPMDFIKNNRFLGSAPAEISTTTEIKQTALVASTEVVADITIPTVNTIMTVIPKIESPAHTEPIKIIEPVTESPTAIIPQAITENTSVTTNFIADNNLLFSDISLDSPLYTATKFLQKAGVANGYADGGFHPEKNISRSEAILLYDRLFNKGGFTPEINLPFLDVLPSEELAKALAQSVENKIVTSSQYFRPNDSLTRAEATTLLIRFSKIKLNTSESSIFKDVKIVNSHMKYINTFAKYLGIAGGNFEPNKEITRGELAKILFIFETKRKKEGN